MFLFEFHGALAEGLYDDFPAVLVMLDFLAAVGEGELGEVSGLLVELVRVDPVSYTHLTLPTIYSV